MYDLSGMRAMFYSGIKICMNSFGFVLFISKEVYM